MDTAQILSILNSSQVQGVQGGNSSSTTGSASSPGTSIQGFPPGTTIRGEIIGRDQQGNSILRTPQGNDISIKTDAFLKFGNQVVIRIDAALGSNGAKILSIDGQSPVPNVATPYTPDAVFDPVVTNSLRANASLASALGAPGPLPVADSDAAETLLIRATLLARAPTTDTTIDTLSSNNRVPAQSLQPGSQVILKIVPQQVLSNTPVVQQASAQGSIPLAGSQTAAVNASPLQQLLNPAPATVTQTVTAAQPAVSTAATTTNTSTPTGNIASTVTTNSPNAIQTATAVQQPTNSASTQASVANSNAQPSQYAAYAKGADGIPNRAGIPNILPNTVMLPPQLAANYSGNQISAVLLGYDPSGDVTFQSPLGILRMPMGAMGNMKLVPGMNLTFDIVGMKPYSSLMGASAGNAMLPAQPYADIGNSWQTLDSIFSIVRAVNPQAAAELMDRFPQTGPKKTSSMMFFISAVTGGDVNKILGNRVTGILEQQGRGDLIRKLSSDLSVIKQGFTETSQPWQLMYFPLGHEGEIHPVRMYIKRDEKDKDKKKGKKVSDTRFVIEVSLSALGDMQLDGYVRQKEKNLQFDLVLRTLEPLPKEDEAALFEIYNSAAQIAGFIGSLNIQTVRQFPVNPLEENLADQKGSIIA